MSGLYGDIGLLIVMHKGACIFGEKVLSIFMVWDLESYDCLSGDHSEQIQVSYKFIRPTVYEWNMHVHNFEVGSTSIS